MMEFVTRAANDAIRFDFPVVAEASAFIERAVQTQVEL